MNEIPGRNETRGRSHSLIVRQFSFVEDKDTGADKQVCPYPCLYLIATIIANIDNICIYRYNSSSLHDAI